MVVNGWLMVVNGWLMDGYYNIIYLVGGFNLPPSING